MPEREPMLLQQNKTKMENTIDSGTPRLPTNAPETPLHDEAHRESEKEFDESVAEKTREEILAYYSIPPESAITVSAQKFKREIRAFSILENAKNPDEKYYADGHTAHAILLDALFKRFPEIGVTDRFDIPDEFFDNWNIKKGFIDPHRNGFHSFTETHEALKGMLLQHKQENGLTEKRAAEIQQDKIELPHWFRSG